MILVPGGASKVQQSNSGRKGIHGNQINPFYVLLAGNPFQAIDMIELINGT